MKILLCILGVLAIGAVDQLVWDGANSQKLVLTTARVAHAIGNAAHEVTSSMLT